MKNPGLYLHIPFCERLCIYCDFYVTTARKYMDTFTEALIREILLYVNRYPGIRLQTICFGGGTPSFLSVENLRKIMDGLRNSFDIDPDAEITLEANPNNLTFEKLKALRSIGFNRLSIGVQSFRDEELTFLTRNHDSIQARESILNAKKAGFHNISMDLIFGLPDQTLEHWVYNIAEAIALNPEHVSVYNLTVEEKTHLNKMVRQKKIRMLNEDAESEMFLAAIQLLTRAEFEHYEISNYAKPGMRSRHNSGYWNGMSYIGIGPSAHSYDGQQRWWNVRDIKKYCEIPTGSDPWPVDSMEELTLQQKKIEYILLNLRKKEGLNIRAFEKIGDFSFNDTFKKPLEKTARWILRDEDHIALSNEGLFLYNKICEEFISVL